MGEAGKVELSEFVSQTLVEIAKGVEVAQGTITDMGGAVNPASHHEGYGFYRPKETKVEFDTEVGVSTADEKSGKAKISVLGQGVSGDLGQTKSVNSRNRIKFSIDMQLAPVPKVKSISSKDLA